MSYNNNNYCIYHQWATELHNTAINNYFANIENSKISHVHTHSHKHKMTIIMLIVTGSAKIQHLKLYFDYAHMAILLPSILAILMAVLRSTIHNSLMVQFWQDYFFALLLSIVSSYERANFKFHSPQYWQNWTKHCSSLTVQYCRYSYLANRH